MSVLFVDIPSYNLPNDSLKISNLHISFLIPLHSPADVLKNILFDSGSNIYVANCKFGYIKYSLQWQTFMPFHLLSVMDTSCYFGKNNLDYCTARSNTFFQVNTIDVNCCTFKYILQTWVKTIFTINCYKIQHTILLDIVHVNRPVWTNLSTILYEGISELSRSLCSHFNSNYRTNKAWWW